MRTNASMNRAPSVRGIGDMLIVSLIVSTTMIPAAALFSHISEETRIVATGIISSIALTAGPAAQTARWRPAFGANHNPGVLHLGRRSRPSFEVPMDGQRR